MTRYHFTRWLGRFVFLASAVSAPAHAQTLIPPGFRYRRDVDVSRSGPHRLLVDLELLARTDPTLSDLRLFDSTNKEVPYLLLKPDLEPPRWHKAKGLSVIVTDKNSSGFEADLGVPLELEQVEILGLPPPVLKQVRIEASGDHLRYTLVSERETLFDLPEESLRKMTVSIPKGTYRYLRILWDDHMTPKLPLPNGIRVRLSREGQPPEPTKATVPFEMNGNRKDVSQYRIQLPSKGLPIDAIVLETAQAQILRQTRVTEARVAANGLDSFVLGTATLRRAIHSGLVASDLRIPIRRPETSTLVLSVDNGNNPPILIKQVYVELAPQPSIFFEANHPGTFSAYFGNDRISLPHYDLEAERDNLAKLKKVDAHWSNQAITELNAPSPSTLPHGSTVFLHGKIIDPHQFRYSRNIVASVESISRLPLDAAVFAHSPTLADVRIMDPESQQIPYVIERDAEPYVIDLKIHAISTELKPARYQASTSVYRVELPYPNLPQGSIVLSTRTRVFLRRVSLTAQTPQLPNKPREISEIVAANWVGTSEAIEPPSLNLSVPAGTYPNLLLAIEDGDNVPLSQLSCKLRLPGLSLRFFHAGGENLTLYYGSNTLGPPSYDLSLLSREIEELPFVEVRLGAEVAHEISSPKVTSSTKWFWAILILTALSLVTFIVRLLRRTT
jgi:hypothetical protein